MFGLGMAELLIIAVVALLFVGPDKLPDAAKKLSKGIREVRSRGRELQQAIKEDEHIGSVVRDLQSSLKDEIREPAYPSRPLGARRSRRSQREKESQNGEQSAKPESEGEGDAASSPPRNESLLEESTLAQTTRSRNYRNVNVRFFLAAEGSSLADRLTVELAYGVTKTDGTFVTERSKTLRVRDSQIRTFDEGDAEKLYDLLVKLYDHTDWPVP